MSDVGFDLMTYYSGNKSGGTPGLLPGQYWPVSLDDMALTFATEALANLPPVTSMFMGVV